jgi:hypothetical protein
LGKPRIAIRLIRTLAALAICTFPIMAADLAVRVSDSTSGKPVDGATVTLWRADGDSLEAETDSQGRAPFSELPPGTWRLHAAKASYVDLLDPAGRGRPIGSASKSVAIELTRAATISGTILDSKGEPFEGAKIVAVARRRSGGASRLVPFGEPGHSDDRGHYRLYGLAPGWYAVAVLPTGEPDAAAFPPAYSEFFELTPGDIRSNVNLVASTSGLGSISGVVSGIPDEQRPNIAGVGLALPGGLPAPIAGVVSESGGAFVIHNVPPGEYRLLAWTPADGREPDGPPASSAARAASRTISISAGEFQADLALQPLVKVSGRFAIEGKACTGEKQLVFQSEDGWPEVWPPVVTVNGDHFTAEGLPVGRYRIAVTGLADSCRLAPGGVVRVDGQSALTLVLTSATGEISGVVDRSDAAGSAGIVILSPADGEGSARVAPVDASGHYSFGPVVVGEYVLVARRGLDSMNYLDAIESSKTGAKLVTVEAGQKVTCELTLARK